MPDNKPTVLKSSLKAWPGQVTLPDPDDFNGVHWEIWKKGVNKAKRKSYAVTHLYCYSGLELIQEAGEWEFEIPIEDVRAWESSPEDERIRFVAWLGRTIMGYMDNIMDPKG